MGEPSERISMTIPRDYGEGSVNDELQAWSKRISEAAACLRQWHQLNQMGLTFKDQDIPDEMKPIIDNLVKKTRTVLIEWKMIPPE